MDSHISKVKALYRGYSVSETSNKVSENGFCKECGNLNSFGDDWSTWCTSCNSQHFIDKFPSWTSGNNNIDELIRKTQINTSHYESTFEWIPYDQFTDIKFISKGGFGQVFKATWSNGPILYWDRKKKQWFRWPRVPVALKMLYNSHNISSDFLSRNSNTCSEIVRCHGISQDPKSKGYIMVLEYCARGDLGKYLFENFADLTWSKCLDHLLDIARGLNTIHSEGLMHRDIHSGNLLIDVNYAGIGDLGLCHPADSSVSKKKVYGVMLFGIIMWELSSGHRPFPNIPHDLNLALQICDGSRPEIVEGTPECYKELMQKCWHKNPNERPNIANIVREIEKWLNDIFEGDDVWSKADRNHSTIKKLPKIKIHSEAVYTSRLLPMINNELFVKRSQESCNELICYHSQASCDEFRISNNNNYSINSELLLIHNLKGEEMMMRDDDGDQEKGDEMMMMMRDDDGDQKKGEEMIMRNERR
ncbi:kinase-like domain-containing protein [Rhizophagus irregularis DAOM 181602=DAOM 197198]|uniref:Kinase-like domain-containing protein n=2 Tax=Rhizophagus irregularis TaxID=588596 RepID=A0A2P4Q3T6_RHIID|nr:kinase-like domain-containing protein [Rhizophagus irregularis DAOM 181602=DAOM 197198]POG72268.1 kinase-like domain-containing protein [Rhizophagus irregularis DAOM 181602=DAOM 197198]GBC39432.2 kinase-like domain-containing protein [Rhizophagus irregularis DAOM 181602=DAOM 197198]|eukprot:XP_025179134.1 kinase-like domain-containing protein [Rhizophagus irregularis DAOM 181602=DAOM 197198]